MYKGVVLQVGVSSFVDIIEAVQAGVQVRMLEYMMEGANEPGSVEPYTVHLLPM